MKYLQITTGRGPAECKIALDKLTRKLVAEVSGARLIKTTELSAILALDGRNAEDSVRPYIGTILWTCPLRENKSRKNWFLGTSLIDLPVPANIVLHDDDLKWDTMRASGPGGQSVNKSDSAVRLTHTPTGVVVTSQDERSQKQNKRVALERMRAALRDRHRVEMAILERHNWQQHNELERGNPVKTFEGLDFIER